jgi:hypothetical protein
VVTEPSDVEVHLIDPELDLTLYREREADCRGEQKKLRKQELEEETHDEL